MMTSSLGCSPSIGLPISAILLASSSSTVIFLSATSVKARPTPSCGQQPCTSRTPWGLVCRARAGASAVPSQLAKLTQHFGTVVGDNGGGQWWGDHRNKGPRFLHTSHQEHRQRVFNLLKKKPLECFFSLHWCSRLTHTLPSPLQQPQLWGDRGAKSFCHLAEVPFKMPLTP